MSHGGSGRIDGSFTHATTTHNNKHTTTTRNNNNNKRTERNQNPKSESSCCTYRRQSYAHDFYRGFFARENEWKLGNNAFKQRKSVLQDLLLPKDGILKDGSRKRLHPISRMRASVSVSYQERIPVRHVWSVGQPIYQGGCGGKV